MPARPGNRPTSFGDAFDALLLAAQGGAPWAWQRLYDSLAPAVVGYLRVQGAQDPEDLSSEVWLAVFRGIASFQGDEHRLRSWVFVIGHRRLIDQRRRAARRADAWLSAAARPPVGAAEDEALRTLADEEVTSALRRLAPAQRDVLLLRIVADLTIDEIARTLGRSEGAVKALQRRGFEALRRQFSLEGVPL